MKALRAQVLANGLDVSHQSEVIYWMRMKYGETVWKKGAFVCWGMSEENHWCQLTKDVRCFIAKSYAFLYIQQYLSCFGDTLQNIAG